MEATVLELRKKMSEVMSAIDRHEPVTITHRGRRRAIILPIQKKKKVKVSELAAFGMWADRDDMKNAVSYVEEHQKQKYHKGIFPCGLEEITI